MNYYSLRSVLPIIFLFPLVSPAEGTCGNGIVEDQEECDCGPVATCKDPCCRALVCTLKEGAECSNLEPCCRNCKFKRKWELCRSAENECDLPEYCTGHSAPCPPNIFHRDGRNCSQDQGYCSKGYCHTHLDQCKIIFKDRPVASASQDCFVRLNTIGNERGHCGNLRACSREDALCGTLQCIEVTREEQPPSTSVGFAPGDVAAGWDSEEDSGGRRREFLVSASGSDCQPIGSTAPLVQDRTKCGEGKICQNQRCVNVSTVFSIRAKCPGYSEANDQECSGNGYCTSRLTCLCHRGWTGRDCSEPEAHTEDVGSTMSTGFVHDIPITRSEPQGVVTHKHENEEDTNYTLGMIFAIAVVTISITFFMCALVYCYLFSSPVSKAKESLDSQGDDYSLDTNNGVQALQTDSASAKDKPMTLQQLEVKVDIPAKNGQVVSKDTEQAVPDIESKLEGDKQVEKQETPVEVDSTPQSTTKEDKVDKNELNPLGNTKEITAVTVPES